MFSYSHRPQKIIFILFMLQHKSWKREASPKQQQSRELKCQIIYVKSSMKNWSFCPNGHVLLGHKLSFKSDSLPRGLSQKVVTKKEIHQIKIDETSTKDEIKTLKGLDAK